jgi:predicted enzyme related to lactoylglutathione lyase
MTTGVRKAGDFCWINMLTPEPAQAREFFGGLLGWTYIEMPGMGHLVQVNGRNIGGLFDLAGPSTPPGTPPLIGVMVKVDSADATAAQVNELGGRAMPAFDIADQGRMAVCFDPNGANFDLWEGKASPGTDADSRSHGAPSWFETLTTDIDRAATFYAKLFGWAPQVKPMPGIVYTTFSLGGTPIAGMMQITPQMGAMPPCWGTYFAVNDAAAAGRETAAKGGRICVPLQDVPDVGRFCSLTSPQGVPFSVIEYTR